jgi:hypothetical protein
MAISRAQLLKELLPGLNTLFNTEYYGDPATWFHNKRDVNMYTEEVRKIPLVVLRNIWLARFGEVVLSQSVHDDGILEQDNYMHAVGNRLADEGYLTYDQHRQAYHLREEPHYAHTR